MKNIFQRRHGQTSLSMPPFNIRFLMCIFIFNILLLLPSVSNAHGLYVSSKEGQLHASFSDHSPASGAVVTVVDEDGIVIVRDTMDEKGMWMLPKDIEGEPKFVVSRRQAGTLPELPGKKFYRTPKAFDYLSVRIAIGVMILGGGAFL